MPKYFLYNPVILPAPAVVDADDFTEKENNYYSTNYSAQNMKVLRFSNVQLDWVIDTNDEPRFDSEVRVAINALNVPWPGVRNGYIGTFDPNNVRKVMPRMHTKFYKFGAKSGPLKIVGDDDILVINGHGNPTGWKISFKAKQGNLVDLYSVSFKTLAALIKADELPRSHVRIHLSSCFGGGVENEAQLVPAFSQKLAVSLNHIGYKKVIVGGTSGAALPDERVAYLNDQGGISIADRASHWREYDHNGMPLNSP